MWVASIDKYFLSICRLIIFYFVIIWTGELDVMKKKILFALCQVVKTS